MLRNSKKSLSKFLCAAMVLVLFVSTMSAVLLIQPFKAEASNPNDSIVGAIRWDGQVGDLSPVGLEEERALGPNGWHFRLPFYATEPTADSCTMRCTTQDKMDQEIAYAKEAVSITGHFAGIPLWKPMIQETCIFQEISIFGVYYNSGWVTYGSAGNCYVPLNFKY